MKPLLVLLALLPLHCLAQTPAPAPGPLPLFRAKMPGGIYEVAVRSMVAVSSHEYVVDGVARVTEVNIDTSGSLLARFYYLEPIQPNTPLDAGAATLEKAQEMIKQAAERTGQDVWKKVVKNYPTTTHARTVEYRLVAKEDVTKVFEAAEEAFRLQKSKAIALGE